MAVSLLVKRIDDEIERQSLLKHTFYKAWSAGTLTVEQLAGYSMEYYQLVKAVPELVSNVASFASRDSDLAQIQDNLEEEQSHVEPWERFASVFGVRTPQLRSYVGAEATRKAVEALKSATKSSFEEGVAAMYAYEMEIPKISRSKIDGLNRFYGIKGGDGTRYFELHEEADVRHAAVWRSIIERSSGGSAAEQRVMDSAVRSLKAQNALLDSVVANYCN